MFQMKLIEEISLEIIYELYASVVVNNGVNTTKDVASDHEIDQLFGNLVIPTIVDAKSRNATYG